MAKRELNRWKGLALGMVSGVVGVIAVNEYRRRFLSDVVSAIPNGDQPPDLPDFVPDSEAWFGRHYRPGETTPQTAARFLYFNVTREEPSPTAQRFLGDVLEILWGMATGAIYGFTRTTTRPRDFAGSFFFGLRLWLSSSFMSARLGLRPDPKTVPLREHIAWLTGHWVFTFVTTNLTRILYRLAP